MERHIWINPDRLDAALNDSRMSDTGDMDDSQVAEINLFVELSPYDTPKAIVGRYDEESRQFVIEFEYIDDEPERAAAHTDGITLFAGKHSNKLLRIVISIDEAPHDKAALIHLQTDVIDALNRFEKQPGRGRLNRRVTRELLAEDFDGLARDLVLSGERN
jgi:hypothetical protein